MCMSCGAPEDTSLVTCKFCQRPYNAELARSAIACPGCKALNRWGMQKCVSCQGWIVVACVFCGAVSPCNAVSCVKCNEAFAGAPQRKAMLDQQRQQQEAMQMVGTVGSVAAPILGGVLGGILEAELESSSRSSSADDDDS